MPPRPSVNEIEKVLSKHEAKWDDVELIVTNDHVYLKDEYENNYQESDPNCTLADSVELYIEQSYGR